MNITITEHNLFRQPKPKPQTRAAITDHAARGIIDAEAERREAKTERLRKARLALEASSPPDACPTATRRRKPAGIRRGKSSM